MQLREALKYKNIFNWFSLNIDLKKESFHIWFALIWFLFTEFRTTKNATILRCSLETDCEAFIEIVTGIEKNFFY